MAGHIDAEHQAVHSQEKLMQQLRQREGDPKTEVLSVGSGGVGVPAQPGGGAAAATQQGQPVLRAGGSVSTHPGQPRAAVNPHFQSNAGPQPPISAPHHQEVYRQRSHSDTEPHPHPSGLTHPPLPQEYPEGQGFKLHVHHGIDTAIHPLAEGVISAVDDESSHSVVTEQHIPHSPNLTCPYCEKQFRMGEIRKYRYHVKSCTGTGGTAV